MKRVLVLGLGLFLLGCGQKNEAGPQEVPGQAEKKGKADVPGLIKQLKDPDYQVRRKAAKTLGEMASEAEAALPALSEMLFADEDSITRDVAAEALRNFGPKARGVVPKLLKALKGEKGYRRDTAISCLGRLGLEADKVVPVLVEAVGEPQPTRNYALHALGDFGPGAKAALPKLQEVLRDPSPLTRLSAARAVWKVSRQSKDVLPVLLAALKDTSPPPPPVGGIGRLDEGMLLRREAAQVLADMGPVAKEAAGALLTATGDRSPEVRVEAALALWKVDRQADPAVEALLAVLETKGPSVGPFPLSGAQVQAAEYLGAIGPPARSALPVLQRVGADRSRPGAVREAAGRAAEKIAR
jgi:HEAT repeat protein